MTILPPTALASTPSASPAPAARGAGARGFEAHLEAALGPKETARAIAAPPLEPGGAAAARSVAGPPRTGRAALGFVERALESQRHLDAAIAAAARGRSYSPQALLALQARVYQASQTLEIFGKTVEQASNAVKQTLETKV